MLQRISQERQVDLEAWEFSLRTAVLAAGAKLLEQMLQGYGCGRRVEAVRCSCGGRMQSQGQQSKTILTILGPITIRRTCFFCPRCGRTRFLADELLDVSHTKFSPGCRRLMARAGAQDTFARGSQDLREYASLTVTAKEVERVAEAQGAAILAWQQKEEQAALAAPQTPDVVPSAHTLYICYDGTGVPIVAHELAGRQGKQSDGSAKTREAFLGCIFTQTTCDAQGRPVREENSTTYIGGIISAAEFGVRIHGEAKRRGLDGASRVVILADGAKKNWTIAHQHFPNAICIVDLYHAREHLHLLLKLLTPKEVENVVQLTPLWLKLLDDGQIEELIAAASARLPRHGKLRQAIIKEINYFKNNRQRMRYAQFRRQGLFVGSGVIEAGCKTIVGQRCKQTSMEWTVAGANKIIASRCAYLSNRLEDFYEQADRRPSPSCSKSAFVD